MNIEEVAAALQQINNKLLTEKEFQYIYFVSIQSAVMLSQLHLWQCNLWRFHSRILYLSKLKLLWNFMLHFKYMKLLHTHYKAPLRYGPCWGAIYFRNATSLWNNVEVFVFCFVYLWFFLFMKTSPLVWKQIILITHWVFLSAMSPWQPFVLPLQILDLPKREKINFRLFSIIAALSEKVTQME